MFPSGGTTPSKDRATLPTGGLPLSPKGLSRPNQIEACPREGPLPPWLITTFPSQGATQPKPIATQPNRIATQPFGIATQPNGGRSQPRRGRAGPRQGRLGPRLGNVSPREGNEASRWGGAEIARAMTQSGRGAARPR